MKINILHQTSITRCVRDSTKHNNLDMLTEYNQTDFSDHRIESIRNTKGVRVLSLRSSVIHGFVTEP